MLRFVTERPYLPDSMLLRLYGSAHSHCFKIDDLCIQVTVLRNSSLEDTGDDWSSNCAPGASTDSGCEYLAFKLLRSINAAIH